MRHQIKYRSGYKYQLAEAVQVKVPIYPAKTIKSEYIRLDPDGTLSIFKGYAWDGPSGPTIDTKTFMRGSLVHDALYQLMREGLLSVACRPIADKALVDICEEDGMCSIRRWYVYRNVRRLAGFAADPENRKVVMVAP